MRLSILLAQLSDLLTFICVASVLPIALEVNPLARAAYVTAGVAGVVALKGIGTAVLLVLVPRSRWPRPMFGITVTVGLVGALSNTIAMIRFA
jgi:hypothetical protein